MAEWSVAAPPVAAGTDKGTATTPTAEQMALGRTIYNAECKQCHDLPKPGDYKLSEWADILPKMIKKANMDKNKGELVNYYVVANAKP